LSADKIYVDIDNCILRDDDDILDVINYDYSRRTFIRAQQPVFLQCVREQRGLC
jgi:hypothetical protein